MQMALPGTISFAGLFLTLALISAVSLSSMPEGIFVYIAGTQEDCVDNRRTIVATALRNGDVVLNQDTVKRANLENRLAEMLRTRAERFLFLKAEPDVPFQEVIEVIDAATKQAAHVAILTPFVDAEARIEPHCLAVSLPDKPLHLTIPLPAELQPKVLE
jgi:biopolymer transport protein ExbD